MSKLTIEDLKEVKQIQEKVKEETGVSNGFFVGHHKGAVFMKVVLEEGETVYGWAPNQAREIAAMMLAAADEVDGQSQD
jgi:hypothetical protein